MSLAEAKQLVNSLQRYSPESVPIFEAAVKEQIEQQTYDLDVNLALLKIYQFNPDLFNKDVVVDILIKTVMALPNPDFNLCFALLTEEQMTDDYVVRVQYLCQLLETCYFKVFWGALQEASEVLDTDQIPGFTDAVRRYITEILSYSYQNIKKELLLEFLNVDDAQLSQIMKEKGWTMKSDDVVSLENNLEVAMKPRSIVEKLDYEYMAKVMTRAV